MGEEREKKHQGRRSEGNRSVKKSSHRWWSAWVEVDRTNCTEREASELHVQVHSKQLEDKAVKGGTRKHVYTCSCVSLLFPPLFYLQAKGNQMLCGQEGQGGCSLVLEDCCQSGANRAKKTDMTGVSAERDLKGETCMFPLPFLQLLE